jgi:hypothetical protein
MLAGVKICVHPLQGSQDISMNDDLTTQIVQDLSAVKRENEKLLAEVRKVLKATST